MHFSRLFALLIVLTPALVRADAPGVFALTGGTVHPVSGPPLTDGVVVIRGGLIELVGARIAIPPDATAIDVTGKHVYPGLIDAQTSLGFTLPTGRATDRPAEPDAGSLAIRTVNITEDDASARRTTGVTTVLTAPTHGIFNGQSVLLNLGPGDVATQVVRNPAALQVSFNTRPMWTYPDSLMGVVSFLRQTFLDAQQHAAAREVYDRAPAGLRRPPENQSLEALRPALRRELPVVFLADSEPMIRRAQAIAREFNLRPVISGSRGAYAMAAELRDVPMLVSVRWPVAPADREDREDQPLRLIRHRQLAPTTPSVLARNGVTFALVSGAGKAGDFLPGIRKAIENGLTAEDALRATTLTPARIFGADRQLGSLERGKIANVIVTDGPLFESGTKVTRLFIDGREVRLPAEPARATETVSPIDGRWNINVRAAEGSVSLQVTLRAEDGQLTGNYSGDRGSGEVRSGSIAGEAFEFTISAAAQEEAEMSDWVFRGTLDGDTMTGNVTTTLGTFEFSGSRSR
jgi:imidazolonepropionase-like amidohydrolase